MEVSVKNLVIGASVAVVASFMVGRFTVPTKVVTKTEIQTVVKTVEVAKEMKKTDQKKDRDVVITETTKPDGTKVKETHYVSHSDTVTLDTRTDTKNTQASTDIKSETITTNEKGNWNIAALAGVNSKDELWQKQIGYGAIVQRRIIGPFYLGGYANGFGSSSQSYGVSIGGSF
jgi:hypothetical protein